MNKCILVIIVALSSITAQSQTQKGDWLFSINSTNPSWSIGEFSGDLGARLDYMATDKLAIGVKTTFGLYGHNSGYRSGVFTKYFLIKIFFLSGNELPRGRAVGVSEQT